MSSSVNPSFDTFLANKLNKTAKMPSEKNSFHSSRVAAGISNFEGDEDEEEEEEKSLATVAAKVITEQLNVEIWREKN